VKVSVDKEDKRGRRLSLTAAGRALLTKAYPLWKQTHAGAERLIPRGKADDLRAALHALSSLSS
jgi:DNA-binding MarR family transcriptional regulator